MCTFCWPTTVAAEIFLELHAVLQRHAEVAGLIVGVEELVGRIDLVHVLPAAAVEGLEERGKADVAEDAVPGQGILQVAHGAIGGAGRVLLVRQQHGFAESRRRAWSPSAKLKNLSSALHQNGLLMTIDPESAAFFR